MIAITGKNELHPWIYPDLHPLGIFKKKVDANILRKEIPPIEGLKKERDLQWKIKKAKKI